MVTKSQNIQNQINEWLKEYKIEYPTEFIGYTNLSPNAPKRFVLGQCWYKRYPQLHCEILLADKYADRKLGWLEMSVLWHEVAHAIAFLEDGISDDHNDHWKDIRKHKRIYWIGDFFAKLVFPFMGYKSP